MSSATAELASTIQAASINRHPDPSRDINPSTSSSRRQPVIPDAVPSELDDDEEEDIPYSVLQPAPRSYNLPPLPDLRFEQSYLRSISKADTWWKVGLITVRDQVLTPIP
jgi:hypothetical protein